MNNNTSIVNTMNTEQTKQDIIRKAVESFIRWELPEDFTPDAGISFTPDYNTNTPYPAKHKPIGTNLFSAEQAKKMFEYALADLQLTIDQSNRQAVLEVLERIEKCNNARINEFGNGEYYEGAKSHIDDLSKEINATRKELEAGGEE